MDEDILKQVREQVLSGVDRDLYSHVGYFLTWYAQVEFRITGLMAVVAMERDFSAFHILTKGMDAGTKVRRLRELCKTKKREIGPAFSARLQIFKDKHCDLRNRLSHTALVRDENAEKFHFVTLDRLPWRVLGMANPFGHQPPDEIDKLTLFEHGLWLQYFGEDLARVIPRAMLGASLEIETPRSPLPQAPPANPAPPTNQPNDHTPDQTPPETQE